MQFLFFGNWNFDYLLVKKELVDEFFIKHALQFEKKELPPKIRSYR